ncbi:hypothetical protein WJX72_003480 [[Myrmecia] bisecta]|uniref:K Homology domain-containing protein n=1 Tax=[Myrmecia] bisecta TaxID=41462 RepID=A0AAW1PNL8_9CHLO
MASEPKDEETGLESSLADLEVDSAPAADTADEEEQPAEAAEEGSKKPAAGEAKVIAKFLVSNAAAGSIIGKAGANIAEFQTQSSARIQLSRSNEFFPGTQERVMLISGVVNQVLTALHLVLQKIKGEESVAESMMARDGKSTQLRLLVPAALCGTIIGKGGAVIRGFSEDSKANITVSAQDKQLPGVSDRVVRVTGDLEQLMRAVALLITKLSENPNYSRFTNTFVNYNTAPMPMGNMPMQGFTGPLSGGPRPERLGPGRTEVTMPVPEARVGAVIGKGGEVINQLKSLVGVRIRISDRDDFVPGTRNRKVTISGAPESVQIAQVLIQQKINQPPQ